VTRKPRLRVPVQHDVPVSAVAGTNAATLAFVVPGKPQPKERARRGAGGRWYTPSATRKYEMGVAVLALAARANARPWSLAGAFALTALVVMPDRRPRDLDNVIKSLKDGCNGVVWEDDSQVVEVSARMEVDPSSPRVEVVVRRLT
jgi:crossover junction endodeoxyribonuclease RusA